MIAVLSLFPTVTHGTIDKRQERDYIGIMGITLKKTSFLLFLFCAALATLPARGSAQKPAREIPKDAPTFVKQAVKKAPRSAYIGIGKAVENTDSPNTAKVLAETRARASLARQVGVVVHDAENPNISTVNATLTNAVIISEGTDSNGNFWTVIMMNSAKKSRAKKR